MRHFCEHCGSYVTTKDYTLSMLRERILCHVMNNHPRANDMVAKLVAEGFRSKEIKSEATKLWEEGILNLSEEGCWVKTVIVT